MSAEPVVAIGSRPRTLVLVVSGTEIEAVMLGPTGDELGQIRVDRTPEPPDRTLALQALWPQLEVLGEFDRISLLTRSTQAEGWDSPSTTHELERQSLRPVRQVSLAQLRWSQIIRRTGVELVVALGSELDSALFVDGTQVPGLALGRLPFRKGKNLDEYLAPRVLQRKGVAAWNRRLERVAHDLLAVWNPTTLYISTPKGVVVEAELGPNVVCVTSPTGVAGALALW